MDLGLTAPRSGRYWECWASPVPALPGSLWGGSCWWELRCLGLQPRWVRALSRGCAKDKEDNDFLGGGPVPREAQIACLCGQEKRLQKDAESLEPQSSLSGPWEACAVLGSRRHPYGLKIKYP